MKKMIWITVFTLMIIAAAAQEDKDVYVAVAVNGVQFSEEGNPNGWAQHQWEHGFHPDSSYEAQKAALDRCQDYSRKPCVVIGTSLRGGCVSVVLGAWRDVREPVVRSQLFAASSNSVAMAQEKALRNCENSIAPEKGEEMMRGYDCRESKVYCSRGTLDPKEHQERKDQRAYYKPPKIAPPQTCGGLGETICADGDTVPTNVLKGEKPGCPPSKWCAWDACQGDRECRSAYPECAPGVLQ